MPRIIISASIVIVVAALLFAFLLIPSASSAVAINISSEGVTIGTAQGSNDFTPRLATIQVGDSVTFTNSGLGFHNVEFDDTVPGGLIPDGFSPSPATTQPWTVTVQFDEPGNYFFFCEPHKDDGMIGRIMVEAPSHEIYIALIAR